MDDCVLVSMFMFIFTYVYPSCSCLYFVDVHARAHAYMYQKSCQFCWLEMVFKQDRPYCACATGEWLVRRISAVENGGGGGRKTVM